MPLADYQQLVDSLVRDRDGVITPADRAAAIDAALAQYSADRPRDVVVDVVSPGGQRIDLPAGFTTDSKLVSIEYPIGEIPPQQIPMASVDVYSAPTARQMVLPIAIAEGDSLRVTYTGAQMLDADADTIPVRHRQAVASLAAGILCGQLASYYSGESDPTIKADTVDYKNKSTLYRSRSKDLLATYSQVIGVAPSERTKGASVDVHLERRDSLGYPRMFHPTRGWPSR